MTLRLHRLFDDGIKLGNTHRTTFGVGKGTSGSVEAQVHTLLKKGGSQLLDNAILDAVQNTAINQRQAIGIETASTKATEQLAGIGCSQLISNTGASFGQRSRVSGVAKSVGIASKLVGNGGVVAIAVSNLVGNTRQVRIGKQTWANDFTGNRVNGTVDGVLNIRLECTVESRGEQNMSCFMRCRVTKDALRVQDNLKTIDVHPAGVLPLLHLIGSCNTNLAAVSFGNSQSIGLSSSLFRANLLSKSAHRCSPSTLLDLGTFSDEAVDVTSSLPSSALGRVAQGFTTSTEGAPKRAGQTTKGCTCTSTCCGTFKVAFCKVAKTCANGSTSSTLLEGLSGYSLGNAKSGLNLGKTLCQFAGRSRYVWTLCNTFK